MRRYAHYGETTSGVDLFARSDIRRYFQRKHNVRGTAERIARRHSNMPLAPYVLPFG